MIETLNDRASKPDCVLLRQRHWETTRKGVCHLSPHQHVGIEPADYMLEAFSVQNDICSCE